MIPLLKIIWLVFNTSLCLFESGSYPCSGAEGIRTPDLFLAKEAFSRLNYGPSTTEPDYWL